MSANFVNGEWNFKLQCANGGLLEVLALLTKVEGIRRQHGTPSRDLNQEDYCARHILLPYQSTQHISCHTASNGANSDDDHVRQARIAVKFATGEWKTTIEYSKDHLSLVAGLMEMMEDISN